MDVKTREYQDDVERSAVAWYAWECSKRLDEPNVGVLEWYRHYLEKAFELGVKPKDAVRRDVHASYLELLAM